MIVHILNALLIVSAVAVFVFWIKALADDDGEEHCDLSECEHCPFPCEERENKNKKE